MHQKYDILRDKSDEEKESLYTEKVSKKKYCWDKLKGTKINKEIQYVQKLEVQILLRPNLSEWPYRFSTIPIKTPESFLFI